MELVKLEVKLLEPALFNARKLGNVYIHSSAYIPAGTLKGAIVNEIFKRDEGLGKKALEELSVSNAYPSGSLPTHAYLFLTKRKHNDFIEKKGILSLGQEIYEEKRYRDELEELKGMNREYEPKSVIGETVKFERELERHSVYTRASASFRILPNVAVSKKSGSSQKGMLFFYEIMDVREVDSKDRAMPDEERSKKTGVAGFWGLVDYDVWKELKLEDELVLSLGKGRIGGLAEVKVVQKSVNYAEKGNAYCFTQCAPSFGSAVFFRADRFLSATSVYQGWFTNDYFASRKPSFTTMKEGSLVSISDASKASRVMPAGLNFMLSIDDARSLLRAVGEVG